MISDLDWAVTEIAFQQMRDYLDVPTNREGDHRLDLSNIMLLAILREYGRLKEGYKGSTSMTAWACRNMMELDVFTKWTLLSEANARRFTNDIAIAGCEMFVSVKEWLAHYDPNADTKALVETIKLNFKRRAEEGTLNEKHLVIRDLAEQVNMKVDCDHTLKFCSKLVHPTAFAITRLDEEEGEYLEIRHLLFQTGTRYGLEAYNAIMDYVATL